MQLENYTSQDVFDCVCKREKDLILPDQDVFNILYGKETMPVDDVIWNYDVRNYSKYLIRSTGKNNLNWTMQNTVVLHFCGKNKRPFTYTTVNGRLFAKSLSYRTSCDIPLFDKIYLFI